MNQFAIDAAARRARVEAGVKWGPVCDAVSPHGLAPLSGSARDVGVVGYTLGGGLGWLGRKHGLACNAVTAIELVTADGTVVRADHDSEPELFWALRGGGGNFGVVTALEFELFPAQQIYAGALLFLFERASELLHAWREWCPTTPDELHQHRQAAAAAAAGGDPRAAARRLVRGRHRRLPRQQGRRRRAAGAAARARPADRHLRDGRAGGAQLPRDGSRGPDAVLLRQPAARRAAARGDRRLRGRRRPRLRLDARRGRAAPARRRARAQRTTTTACAIACSAPTSRSPPARSMLIRRSRRRSSWSTSACGGRWRCTRSASTSTSPSGRSTPSAPSARRSSTRLRALRASHDGRQRPARQPPDRG